jgi:membrane protease YdiL (CAAX protease family)
VRPRSSKSAIALILFFVFVGLFAFVFEGAAIALRPSSSLITGLMWSVAIAAMLALKLTGQSLSSLGWRWGSAKHHLIAFFLPLVYGAITYAIAAALGFITFAAPEQISALVESERLETLVAPWGFVLAIIMMSTIGMAQSMATALGEEIGWRGFLTPRLTALTGFIVATLVTGLIWGAWHLPLLFLGTYQSGANQIYEAASFVVMATAISGALAWLRLDSGSLWPAATLHASHNIIVAIIFESLSTPTQGEITMVSEAGVLTAIVCVVVCIPFWVMGARISRETAAAQSA